MDSRQGKSNRDRGASAERQVRDIFRMFGFGKVRRGYVFEGEPDIVGAPGLHIEVKYQKHCKVWEWLAQADTDAAYRKDGNPVLFFRRPGEPFRVIVPAKMFMEMYTLWEKANYEVSEDGE